MREREGEREGEREKGTKGREREEVKREEGKRDREREISTLPSSKDASARMDGFSVFEFC